MIALEGVSKSFDGGATWAARDVDLEVAEGELVALVGESGSGKTTTLKTINRLVEPTNGSVTVDGRDVSGVDPVRLRRGIGYVFQGIGLFPHMSVAQNVGAVPRLLGWPRGRIDARVDELLELVGLEPARYRARAPRELSGGQQQRVGVARALAAEPKVMLMDEPFGALDPVTRAELQDELRRLQAKLGLTTVLVTHDMSEALLMADRVAVMREGGIVALGTPRELLADPGDDYAREILAAPRRNAQRLAELEAPAEPEG